MIIKSKLLSQIDSLKSTISICRSDKIKQILNLQIEIEKIDLKIAGLIAEKNAFKIKSHYSNLTDFGCFNVTKMWQLKKKILPSKTDQPSAKKDQKGNLISDKKSLLNLYKEEYIR